MTQAPTPSADTVRRLVRSLLKDGGGGKRSRGEEGRGGAATARGADPDVRPAGPDVRPAGPDAGPGGEGVSAATWWVGSRHVLRLAPDREATLRQRRELRVRDLVRPHLPMTVPVSVATGEWAPGLHYTLDTKVPGGSAERHDVSAVGEADLAALLTGLREVPLRQAETLGVPRAAPRSLEALRRAAARAAQRLAGSDEFDAAGLDRLTAPAAAQLAAQPGSAVLTHHALTAAHLVVSADGRVRGVLGWGGAVAGDPAEDIAGLAAAVGSPAAVRAATLAGYGARPCLRGLWLARCDTVVHLAEALTAKALSTEALSTEDLTTEGITALRTRLRHAWEPILLERVTDLGAPEDVP
ncbi:aminoglycoside phosphotransferase family protein [Streptomyces sp. NPDC004830]